MIRLQVVVLPDEAGGIPAVAEAHHDAMLPAVVSPDIDRTVPETNNHVIPDRSGVVIFVLQHRLTFHFNSDPTA